MWLKILVVHDGVTEMLYLWRAIEIELLISPNFTRVCE